jgi:hypothetical protein
MQQAHTKAAEHHESAAKSIGCCRQHSRATIPGSGTSTQAQRIPRPHAIPRRRIQERAQKKWNVHQEAGLSAGFLMPWRSKPRTYRRPLKPRAIPIASSGKVLNVELTKVVA